MPLDRKPRACAVFLLVCAGAGCSSTGLVSIDGGASDAASDSDAPHDATVEASAPHDAGEAGAMDAADARDARDASDAMDVGDGPDESDAFDAQDADAGDANDARDASDASDGDATIAPVRCPLICGPLGNADCCDTKVVPGGSYLRSNDSAYPATVSSFKLDTYEATVGRFRAYLSTYSAATPVAGDGKNPSNPSDTGWNATWNAALPTDAAAFSTALQCLPLRETWTPSAGSSENMPINCLTWYEAYAFCIWDGGRLPTEAEWNYAAASGSEQRVYPWSVPATSTVIDGSYAVYEIAGVVGDYAPVGSKSPKGDGRWGHADLAGNIFEWVLDGYASPYALTTCVDCADFTNLTKRALRGGSKYNDATGVSTIARGLQTPGNRVDASGVRCARPL